MRTISETKLALRKTRVQKIVIIAFKLNVAGFCAVKKASGEAALRGVVAARCFFASQFMLPEEVKR
jgi:hypothetical protein